MRGQPSQNTVAVFWYVGQDYLIQQAAVSILGNLFEKDSLFGKVQFELYRIP